MPSKKILYLALIIIALSSIHLIAQSGRIYRRSTVLNGNQVRTVYGNWGVIGQPASGGPRGAWIYESNGYIGDVSPIVGAEVTGQIEGTGVDTSFFWMVDCPAARPSLGVDESTDGTRQAFEPLSGYFNPDVSSPAVSSKSGTWPNSWPDILDPDNPRYSPDGWAGSWNGFFGRDVFNADLETYFVMDDDADNEFNIPSENQWSIEYWPIPSNQNRHGMGMEVSVRGLQWQQILAQDNIFWLYNIKNTSEFTYPRAVFGMLVGTYVGVTGTDDSPEEYNDDYSFFDVNEDLTYTGDYPGNNNRNPFWQGKVGIVGYAFLESPGNPFDGIDNDNDASENGALSSAPLFTASDFEQNIFTNDPTPSPGYRNLYVTIEVVNTTNPFGQEIVEYQRTVHTITEDTTIAVSLGDTTIIIAGETAVVEGNALNGGNEINENALDGKDNDLDGLIDENYFLHYRQRRTSSTGQILFDILNPVAHVNYLGGIGIGELMVDERRDDGVDNDGDWSQNPATGEPIYNEDGNLIDDVGADGQSGTQDPGENDGVPTPGEPNFDALDKSESDQIGLTSFQYFSPANEINLQDDDDLRERMRPGFFEVPTSIVNGEPISGEDGDFLYGTGYFPMTPSQTERLSLALIYGFDTEELVDKLETVRDIYNADYRFPIAPDKPTLTIVPGDGQVTLYWDRKAEKSFDPVLKEFDFEGYKIYKSTDPAFLDVRTITNSNGNVVAYEALEQFDLKNNISGWYYPLNDLYQTLQGWSFFRGSNSGLEHSYVDTDVSNGQTYYYAVVSYDKGNEITGILPSECTKQIVQNPNGTKEYDINTGTAAPTKAKAGYTLPQTSADLDHIFGEGFGTVSYKVIDPTALTGNSYEVYFWDTSNDKIDNDEDWTLDDDLGADGIGPGDLNYNGPDPGEGDLLPTQGEPNFDYKDPDELEAVTTRYAVKDLTEYSEEFTVQDTQYTVLSRGNFVENSVMVRDGFGSEIDASNYIIDMERGKIRAAADGLLAENQTYSIHYQYHPVYFSPNMQESPWTKYIIDTDIFDGLTLNFDNKWESELDTANSGWNQNIDYSFILVEEPLVLPSPYGTLYPVLTPANYEIRIYADVIDSTTSYFDQIGEMPRPTKFQIYNVTGDYNIEYYHDDVNGNMYPDNNERIYFIEKDPEGEFNIFAWQLYLKKADPDYTYTYTGGEVLSLVVKFPFNRLDRFSLQTEVPQIDEAAAKTALDDIQVFPNPYIAAHEFEPALPTNITSGRGERKIYFAGVPQGAKIYIFTTRGDKVITLKDDQTISNGTIVWNLKTSENLDVAFGVYFYVIESSAGTKRGKLAIIK